MIKYPLSYLYIKYKNNEMYDFIIYNNAQILKEVYRNLKVLDDDKNKSFIDYWLESDTLPKYESIEFLPGKNASPDNFNMSKRMLITFEEPIKLSEEEEKSYKMIHKLLLKLCNNDVDVMKYVLSWLGHMIQKPWEKPGIAILMMSTQGGIGKNAFWQDLIGKRILGLSLFNYASHINDLVGRFNTGLAYKLLTICDEINSSTFKEKDYIKCLITSSQLNYERKNKDSLQVEDYNRFVFLTNNLHPVLIEKGDRRFLAIECSLKLKGNERFFDKFYIDVIDNPRIIRHFYDELKEMDLSDFRLRNIPHTSYKKDLEDMSRSLYVKSLEENYIKYANTFVSSSDLYGDVLSYCEKHGIPKGNVSHQKMGREYNDLNIIMSFKRLRTGRGYNFKSKKVLDEYFE